MRPRGLPASTVVALLAGCSSGPEAPPEEPAFPPEASEIVVQAVDAGTGAALSDDELTIRYLVHSPITLDASAVEKVPSAEPYRVSHEVSSDSMVLEMRLEAESYFRLDTVLAVARGRSAGPLTVRMARRLDRTGQASPSRPAQTGGGQPAGGRQPTTTPTRPAPQQQPAEQPPPAEEAPIDRTQFQAGDDAFNVGDWQGAVAGYVRLTPPTSRRGAYAREYQLALVRMGISYINLGQWQQARTVLEQAVDFDFRDYTPYFHLGQVQCALGDFNTGRRTLEEVDRLSFSIPAAQRQVVGGLLGYRRAMCSYNEWLQARPINRVAAGQAALRDLQAFIRQAEAMKPIPPPVLAALNDARTRVREIR